MYIVVNEDEYELRKWEVRLTPWEVSELLEYSDVIEKWLKKNVNRIQSGLALCKYQGKENEAYINISCIKYLLEDLKKMEENYREFINRQEEKKDK